MRRWMILQAIAMVCLAFNVFGYRIEGFAPAFKGKVVYLERFENYITFNKITLSQSKVDEQGKFSIALNPTDAFEAFLRIDNNSGIIFIDPETEVLSVSFPAFDKIPENVMRENRISLIFDGSDYSDLNALILEFNYRKDEFLYQTIVKDTSSTFSKLDYSTPGFQKDLEQFKDSLQLYYKDVKKHFFIDYITYSIAELEQLAGIKEVDITRSYLYSAYLKGISPRYNYVGYMRFFNLYYNDFFKVPYFGPEEDIIDAINFHQSYQRCMQILSRTKLLENPRVRELVLMKNLLSAFYQKRYSQEGIINVLDSLNMVSPYEENKSISLSILKHITKMLPGVPAPEIKGVNILSGEEFRLSGLGNKYVYLMFHATWCKPCMAELALIPDLKKKYGQYVEFVTIFMDSEEVAAKNFLQSKKNYDWHFVSLQGNQRILDAYNVRSAPHYVLIDQDGLIEKAPARSPSPDGVYLTIDKEFFDIKTRLEPKREFKIGGKN